MIAGHGELSLVGPSALDSIVIWATSVPGQRLCAARPFTRFLACIAIKPARDPALGMQMYHKPECPHWHTNESKG
jgi:hypothetical protein